MSKEEKIEELQELLREDPENYRARRELALILVDSGFAKEAAQNLKYLILKIPNDADLYYNLGIAYEKMKRFNDAKHVYLKSLEISPDSVDTIYNLGLVYTELRQYDKGVECFKKVIAQDSNDSNSYFNMGICYLKKKDLVNAILNFQNTIDINDEDLYAHFYIANILFEIKDYEGAKAEFTKVIELSPDYSWAYYNLACIAYEEGDYEHVALNLDKTIQLNPKDIGAYINYSKLLAKMDMYDDAKTVILSATQTCPNVGQVYYYAAQLAKACSNNEDYVAFLKEAIANTETLDIDVNKVMAELEKATEN